MADNNDIIQKRDMYNAFMDKRYSKLKQLCHNLSEGPLWKISIYNDTVLHMAAHSKQKDPVLELLEMLPKESTHQFSNIKNKDGNTILHEVATSDAMKDVAEKLLRSSRDADHLLFACNDLGEKPIFCAARYGQTQMFEFLAYKMGLKQLGPEESKAHLKRNDGTTVLHISIASECFGLAKNIAECYPCLIEERDQDSMTALQYLACNPTAFRMGELQIRKGFIEQVGESIIIMRERSMDCLLDIIGILFRRCIKRDERHLLKDLVMLLVEKDTSWDASINSQAVSQGESKKEPKKEEYSSQFSQKKEGQNSKESSTSKYKKSDESPLFLATMSNIKEIVKVVLNFHPEALKHTNKEGMNILQVAILYRHIDIFDMVVKSEVLARRLLSATDNEGNSILHIVSQKRKSQASEKMQSPALQLRDELLLFEKVKSASKMLVRNPLNKDHQTAEELFAASNEKLHQEAKEWLMRTTENCTILSVFIATVAFAAAYTVPGGPNQDTGIPILHSEPLFALFISADMISLTLALTSVGIFLSILTSSFPLQDFKTYLFKKLIMGIICLILSVSMMAVAFGATVLLMGLDVGLVAAFLPVPIFFLSYSPLRSAVLGVCLAFFISFVMFLTAVVFMVVTFPLVLLCSLPYCVFKGLRWTVKRAYGFIIWISRKKSQPESDTQSPQPPAPTRTQV